MSSNRDKPGDPDPDATVTFQRSDLIPPIDPEATVALQRSSLVAPPDDDATVMIPAGGVPTALGAKPDDDATVMIPPRASPAYDENATVMMPPPKEAPVADEDATVMLSPMRAAEEREADAAATPVAVTLATPTTPATPEPEVTRSGTEGGPATPASGSRMPWIVGGAVLLLAGLFFFLKGGKEPAAPASAPAEVASSSAAVAASAASPAAVSTPATAPTSASAAAPIAAPISEPSAAPASSASLKTLLSEQFRRNQVSLVESGEAATINFRDERQFSSGDIDPNPKLKAVILEVAAALDKMPGGITVIGHTDDTRSGSTRFSTNQALSAARADAVVNVMATKIADPKRIKSEGAAATQPIVPNNSASNRAKNRRVVIVLRPMR